MSGNPIKSIGHAVSSGFKSIGHFVSGTTKTILSAPLQIIGAITGQQQGQQIVYSDSGAASNSAETPLYQTSQSTGSDQFDSGESPSSVGSSSILIGNKSGNIFLGKQSLLGKRK